MRLINIIASNGKFVSAEGGGGYIGPGSLIANRTTPLGWEQFVEEPFEDGAVSLKTNNGNYVTAEDNGDISTNRTSRGLWERWYKINEDGYKSVHGNFMGLDEVNEHMEATKNTQGDKERLNIVDLNPIHDLPRLHISGRYFYNELGQKVYIQGTTDFMLFKWFLEGHDITFLLRQRKENGCNAVRVIGMVSWFDYTPQKYGVQAYLDAMPAFLDSCAFEGLYVYWTVFADTRVVMPNAGEQINFFNEVVAQLKTRNNTIGELVNEPYTGTNATANPLAFTRPTGIAFSSGSYNDKYGSQLTPPPYWDFHDFHVPRKDVKRVKDQCVLDHPNYIKKGMAILSGEPDKFGGPNQYNGQIYMSDLDISRQMAVTAEGTCCGYFYHTSAGNFSVLWNETEINCCPFRNEAK